LAAGHKEKFLEKFVSSRGLLSESPANDCEANDQQATGQPDPAKLGKQDPNSPRRKKVRKADRRDLDQLIPSEIARARPRPEKGDAKPAVCERVEDSMRGGGKKQESESDAETGV
jgi:hypothetical protein